MSNPLPEIDESCRCGSSIRLVGWLATDDRLEVWRQSHRCLSPDEQRFRDLPSRAGSTALVGFAPQWEHDRGPILR